MHPTTNASNISATAWSIALWRLNSISGFPALSEGELSRLRANLVNQQSLAAIAQRFSFGEQLRLGEGELKSGGARRPSMLADAVEAVIGAVVLDGGFDAARGVVRVLFGGALDAIDPAASGKDPKTLLQEYLQGRRLALPQYSVVATRGEAHQQLFRGRVRYPRTRHTVGGRGGQPARRRAGSRAPGV